MQFSLLQIVCSIVSIKSIPAGGPQEAALDGCFDPAPLAAGESKPLLLSVLHRAPLPGAALRCSAWKPRSVLVPVTCRLGQAVLLVRQV